MIDELMRTARLHWSNGGVSTTNILAEGEPPMMLQENEWDKADTRTQHIFRFRVGQNLHASIIEYDEIVAPNTSSGGEPLGSS